MTSQDLHRAKINEPARNSKAFDDHFIESKNLSNLAGILEESLQFLQAVRHLLVVAPLHSNPRFQVT